MKIRRCEINDADNMLKMLLELDKETEYMLFEVIKFQLNLDKYEYKSIEKK